MTSASYSRRQLLFAVAGSLPASQRPAAAPPNVVLVMTDDQGYGDLACHGNPLLKTPNLDKLHSRSVRFTNYHVSPTCAPTRSALFTGRYTNATGAWHTIMGRSLLRPGEVTLADCFRASGYRTGIFGKWHLGDNYPRPQDRGFDFGNDYFDDTYFMNGRPEKHTGFCTDVWFESNHRRPPCRQSRPLRADSARRSGGAANMALRPRRRPTRRLFRLRGKALKMRCNRVFRILMPTN
ncbi:MAG: hypothetical protein FJW20_26185 [Acidimicrobiia bacterium]|nr:hypothetical protein [Acidimicrobiia bacterium]